MVSAGANDAFIMRLDSTTGLPVQTFGSGGLQKFGGSGADIARAIACNGNYLFVAGDFDSTNAGIGGTGTFATNGGTDGFVLALNATTGAALTGFGSNGIQKFGGAGADNGTALAVSNSAVYLGGSFTGFGAKIGTSGFYTASMSDAYVIALDPSTGVARTGFGNSGFQKFGGSSNDYGRALAFSGTTLLLSGDFSSTNAGVGANGSISTLGAADGYILALDAGSGAVRAAFASNGLQRFCGSSAENVNTLFTSATEIFAAGTFGSTNAGIGALGGFNSTNTGGFLLQLDLINGSAAPQITSALNATGTFGTPFSYAISATCNPTSLLAADLPSGLTLSNGVISGTPTESGNFTVTLSASNSFGSSSASLLLQIDKAVPTLSWSNPQTIVYGTQLSAVQLDASSNVPGTFAYNPPAGTLLNAGIQQTLSVTFSPADNANYTSAIGNVYIDVSKAAAVISWPAPADIVYGTALGAAQLNASSNVAGTFAYTPAAGTVLNAGNAQTLSVAFTPADAANYSTGSASTTINVLRAIPVLTWANPADIVYGTALSTTQLNATADVPGTFAYSPVAGTVLSRGNAQTLSVIFDPADDTNYELVSGSVLINVLNAAPVILSGPTATPNPVRYSLTTTLSATASDPENDTLTYTWSFGDGSPTATGNSVTHSYAAAGTYLVTVTVIDGHGGSVTGSVNVVVNPNAAPTVAVAASSSANPPAGGTSNLSVLGADDLPESGLTYTWATTGTPPGTVSFSANGTNAAKNTVATFPKVGTYNLQVTIRDAQGATATSSVSVTASPITVTFQDGVNGYAGTRDTCIKNGSQTTNFGNDPTFEFNCGNTDIGALIKWDLSAIPAGSTIQSVQITLEVTNASTQTFTIYELKRAWVETGANWKAWASGSNWQTAGASGANDRGSTSLGTVVCNATGSRTTTLNASGIALVQNWINNPSTNNGFTFQNYAGTADNVIVHSSESPTVTARPKLTITYAP